MRVALCVPSEDSVKADFWLSWTELVATALTDRLEPIFLNARTSLIPNSRFILARDALARGADYVLFVDSDMTFPGDALRRLLGHSKPIVGATYARRREPYGVLGYAPDGAEIPPGATGLWPFARLPGGMLLIAREVFDRVPRPWFPVTYRPETDDYESEDFGFCRWAIEAGYDIWCDLDLSHELGHVGQIIHTWGKADA